MVFRYHTRIGTFPLFTLVIVTVREKSKPFMWESQISTIQEWIFFIRTANPLCGLHGLYMFHHIHPQQCSSHRTSCCPRCINRVDICYTCFSLLMSHRSTARKTLYKNIQLWKLDLFLGQCAVAMLAAGDRNWYWYLIGTRRLVFVSMLCMQQNKIAFPPMVL